MKLTPALVLLFAALIASPANAALFNNGDFSLGNTGFSTSYTFSAADPPNVGGNYTVDTSPSRFNSGMANFPDHTSGTGQMLIVDGSTDVNAIVWQEVIFVLPDTDYLWTTYAASAGETNGNLTDPSPATLLFRANLNNIGAQMTLPGKDGTWQEHSGTFNSGSSGVVLLTIQDTNTAFLGNDFALDDITFTTVPEPASFAVAAGLAAILFTRRRSRPRHPSL